MQFVFFLLFVVSVLTLGSISIGPFSLRVYMTVLMLAFLILGKKPASERYLSLKNNYIHLFLICIVTLGISLTINGGLQEYGFFVKCLSHYLVCIVAYYAVDRCVKSKTHIDKFVAIISFIVLFDAIVTYLQYQNNPIGWAIGIVFSDESQVEEFTTYLADHQSFEGVSKIPGIFGHPVNNGFFLAVTTPMLLTGIGRNNPKLKSLFYLFTIIVTLIVFVLLQQRAAIFLVLMVLAYHFIRAFVKNPSRLLLPFTIVLILAFIVLPNYFGDFDWGRLSSTDNSSRTEVWKIAYTFIINNPIFGDFLGYSKVALYSAHNALIDSLINSGIIGFIPLLYLYLRTVLDSSRILLRSNDNYCRIFSYCVLICMAMGLFHNTSYMTGDVIIFFSLGLMFKAQVLSKYKSLQARV